MSSNSNNDLQKDNFFNYVFNMNDDSKGEYLNVIQYSLLSLIPVIILNKGVGKLIPEVDDEKGSPEILVEICGQVVVMFLGIVIINRIVTYVPTYSNIDYKTFNINNVVVIFLIIMLSLQTKLGEKTNIILERLHDYVYGVKEANDNKQQQQPNHPDTTMITALGNQPPPNTQNAPNFNNMYAGPQNPLANANSPGQNMMTDSGPMPSNMMGSAFGSTF